MIKVVTSDEMRSMDRYTIEKIGIPGIVLMENAGSGTSRIIQKILDDFSSPLVYIYCGKGNNGGDGYVIGRYLWDKGANVNVFIIGKKTDLSGDALINFNIIEKLGIPFYFISSVKQLTENLNVKPHMVVDALLGTGITGSIHGLLKNVIELINEMNCPVISVDIPSGLNADSPSVDGTAIKADITVTMGLPKYCQVFYPAKEFVGDLYIAEIGIPHYKRNSPDLKVNVVEKSDIDFPKRTFDSHKYQCGKVAVLAGSPGYTGAATLTAEASIKIGAGLTILAIPEKLNAIIENKLTEVISRPYQSEKGFFITANKPEIRELLDWCDVLAIGPGLGRTQETQSAIIQLLSTFNKPVVIDADALFALSHNKDSLKKATPNWIITPHHGEFIRLMNNIDKEQIRKDPIKYAQSFSKKYNLTLLLKGAPSLVSSSNGEIYINSTGNPSLSSGGTGDVLTGFVAGLLAQGMEPIKAAYTANYLHGLCADELLSNNTIYSITASDLIKNIGLVTKKNFFDQED